MRTKRVQHAPGFEGWYPYYAGFPLSFALDEISRANGTDLILDPWNGSGTTTHAARITGRRSVGFDLNPVAAQVAIARGFSTEPEHFLRLALGAISNVESAKNGYNDDPLHAWLTPDAVCLARSAVSRLRRSLRLLGQREERHAFIDVLVINAVRRVLKTHASSNPTWSRVPKQPFAITSSNFSQSLHQEARSAFRVLEHSQQLGSRARSKISVGDARHLPLKSSSVDFVLTSPPYCTRIDYAVTTRFEQAFLSVKDAAHLRHELMGTTLVRAEREGPQLCLEVQDILSQVTNHPSYEASGYYRKNFTQYFQDATDSMSELTRVLRPNGRASVVVQSSYFKEVHIDLPQLYAAMGRFFGMNAVVTRKERVQRTFADINRHARVPRASRKTYEAVVEIIK